MSLPRFVIIKSSYNRFLSVEKIGEKEEEYGVLQFKGFKITNPGYKFEVEPAKVGSGLVHIRSCYNNKYLVRSSDPSSPSPLDKGDDNWEIYITATAKDPEEDQSKWSCTLFKPIFVDNLKTNNKDDGAEEVDDDVITTVKLAHVDQLGGHLLYSGKESRLIDGADDGGAANPNHNVFKVIDFSSVAILPRHATFIGDNDRYLKAERGTAHDTDRNALEFSVSDVWDPTVNYEIFTLDDGSIAVRSIALARYWRRDDINFIRANLFSAPTQDQRDSLFTLTRINDNTFAFRNLGNQSFCRRHTWSYLAAVDTTISPAAQIKVEERILDRAITGIRYHLNDARIYDVHPEEMHTVHHLNNGSSTDIIRQRLYFKETRTSSWRFAISAAFGVNAKFRAGIPFIKSATVEVSWGINAEFEMGKTFESSTEWEKIVTVEVPPRTDKKIVMLGTVGKCDVPFSYIQTDRLFDGRRIETLLDGGVYTGVNSYNLYVRTSEQPL